MPSEDQEQPIKSETGNHLDQGHINRKKIVFNTAIQVVSTLVIIVLLNYLSFSQYLRWDLSTTKKFSVSDETKNYIKEQLDKRVTITMAFLKSSKVRKQLKLLLEEYSRISDRKIIFNHFDPVIDKTNALEITNRYEREIDQNSLFIEIDGKVKRLTENDLLDSKGRFFTGEDAITSAMLAVTEDKPKTVYLIAGKGRLKEVNDRSADKELINLSQKNFFNLKELTLGNITKIPDDADSLILINPETDFTLSEVGIITKYWEEQRGALVLLLNPSIEMPNFYPFLRSLGIRVDNKYRVLFSETTGIGGAQKIYDVQSKLLPENPITSNDSGKITTFAGQTCPLSVAENNEMLLAKGIIATPLMVADPKFWGDLEHTESYPKQSDQDMLPSKNPIYVAAMVEKGSSDGDATGINNSRLVVVANSTLLDPIPTKLNIEFVMNSINWTLDRQERIGINPTNLSNYKINMSAEKYQTLFYLIVCILPAGAFLFGIAMWSARRN